MAFKWYWSASADLIHLDQIKCVYLKVYLGVYMGKPLMIQIEDEKKIEQLKEKLQAKTKIQIVRMV